MVRRVGREPLTLVLADLGYKHPATRAGCGNCIGSIAGKGGQLWCSKGRKVVAVHKLGICPSHIRS